MAMKFQVRSTQLNAFYASAIKDWGQGSAIAPTLDVSAVSGVFGGHVINMSHTGGNKFLTYVGLDNFALASGAFSVLMRFVPNFTGPSPRNSMLCIGNADGTDPFGLIIQILADNTVSILASNGSAGFSMNFNTVTTAGCVSGQPMDLWVTWDGSTTAGKFDVWTAQNGNSPTKIGSFTGSSFATARPKASVASMILGSNEFAAYSDFLLNELVIWDDQVDPSSFGARTDFITASAFEGYSQSDPGIANVTSGVSYTSNGVAKVGTNVSTDPGQANVLTGVAYQINSAAKTGTSVSTDPGQANVISGTAYQVNSVAKTGSYVVLVSTDPGQANVLIGVSYQINNVSKSGSYVVLVSTDPGVANVLAPTAYTFNNTSKVGTYYPPASFAQAKLGNKATGKIIFTQGDDVVMNFVATDGSGNAVNITGATFTTSIIGLNGATATFQNAKHSITNAALGQFSLTLNPTDSALCGLGSGHEIITTMVQAGNTTHYHGVGMLTVEPASTQ